MRGFFVVCLVLTVSLFGGCSSGPTKSSKSEEKQNPAEINTQLGIEYMREGMYESSMEKLKKAIMQNPNYQLAHTSIAILYEKLGEDKLADKHYKQALKNSANDPVVLNLYGVFLCRHGLLAAKSRRKSLALVSNLSRTR